MDNIKLAILGNKDAAKRLTEAGVLLPCGHCKGKAVLVEGKVRAPGKYRVVCCECFCATMWCSLKEDAIGIWNTRAPIMSSEEMEELSHG